YGMTFCNHWFAVYRVHGDEDERDPRTEIGAKPVLQTGHDGSQQRTGVRATCKDECDCENPPAQILQCDSLAVLIGQRELGRGPDLREALLAGGLVTRYIRGPDYRG